MNIQNTNIFLNTKMNTNNQNQEHLTEDGYIKPSGLSLPTQSYSEYNEQQQQDEALMADWDKHQGQPSVAMIKNPYESQEYVDSWEEPVQELEEGAMPNLPNLINQRRLS